MAAPMRLRACPTTRSPCRARRVPDAARLVMAEGAIVEGKDGQRVRHPAVIVEREAAETVRRLAREFGLTPSGRADLGHALPPPPLGLGPERLLT
jgi:P27 family predicted phage terminase small subunit